MEGDHGTFDTTKPATPDTTWFTSFSWTVPASAVSGFYLVKLENANGDQSYIIFVVRDDASTSEFVFNSPVLTYQAYNNWPGVPLNDTGDPQAAKVERRDGKSLYCADRGDEPYGCGALKVSFNRPYAVKHRVVGYPNPAIDINNLNRSALVGMGAGSFLTNLTNLTAPGGWEYPMVRFLEKEGYDVSYMTDIDLHERGDLLLNHKAFMVVGHSEYWTLPMRTSLTSARDKGVNLAFFSGNTMYWQVRLEQSALGVANRTLVGFKGHPAGKNASGQPVEDYPGDRRTYMSGKYDPQCTIQGSTYMCTAFTTTLWSSDYVQKPESLLVGIRYQNQAPVGLPGTDYSWSQSLKIVNLGHWLLEGLPRTQVIDLPGLVGHEADGRDEHNEPGNLVVIGDSPIFANSHNSVVSSYTTPKGGIVFAAGTNQWSWGLDYWDPCAQSGETPNPCDTTPGDRWRKGPDGGAPPDPNYPQAATAIALTKNLLARMRFRRARPADFDGDGRTDYSVWRPSGSDLGWYVAPISGATGWYKNFGAVGDVQVPEDYDGDGRVDYASWRSSTKQWVVRTAAGADLTAAWGLSTDVPVPGDYTGDGRADFAVWRPSAHQWFVLPSPRPGQPVDYNRGWAVPIDAAHSPGIPVPADYNGDGMTDFAFADMSTGTWVINISRGEPATSPTTIDSSSWRLDNAWGAPGDIPIPGDYTGDGKADYAVFRPSSSNPNLGNAGFYILQNMGLPQDFNKTRSYTSTTLDGQTPVPGDYDGDGTIDFASWKASTGTWSVMKNPPSGGGTALPGYGWGLSTDIPTNRRRTVAPYF
jgi:hypothetical protein